MNSRLTTITIILALLICRNAWPNSEPVRLSLKDALKIASERHVNVIVSNERVNQAIDRLGQSVSPLLPQVTAGATQKRQTMNLKATGIPISNIDPLVGPYNSFDARISLTQTIFDLAAIERLRAAHAGKKLSKAELIKAKQDAMALVGTLYIEAERSENIISVAQELLKRDEAQLRIAQQKIKLGTGSDLDLKKAESDCAAAEQGLISAETDALERRLDLAAALGIPNNLPVLFIKETDGFGLRAVEAEDFAAPEITPALQVAEELVKQRSAERWAEWAELLPKFSGLADYGASGKTPSDQKTTYTMGIKATLPLFEGGQTFFRIREAASRWRESKAQLKDVLDHEDAKIQSAVQTIKQTAAAIASKNTELAVAEKEFALSEHRLQTGIGSLLETTAASAQLSFAKDQKDEAVATYCLAQINLAHITGEMESLIGGKTL